MKYKKFLITGGLGFIGGNFLKILTNKYPKSKFLNIDKFTYAASKDLAKELKGRKNYNFHKVDICDFNKLKKSLMILILILLFILQLKVMWIILLQNLMTL